MLKKLPFASICHDYLLSLRYNNKQPFRTFWCTGQPDTIMTRNDSTRKMNAVFTMYKDVNVNVEDLLNQGQMDLIWTCGSHDVTFLNEEGAEDRRLYNTILDRILKEIHTGIDAVNICAMFADSEYSDYGNYDLYPNIAWDLSDMHVYASLDVNFATYADEIDPDDLEEGEEPWDPSKELMSLEEAIEVLGLNGYAQCEAAEKVMDRMFTAVKGIKVTCDEDPETADIFDEILDMAGCDRNEYLEADRIASSHDCYSHCLRVNWDDETKQAWLDQDYR